MVRLGPVIEPHQVGVSTLCAMEVPEQRLEEVANFVSSFDEVNHNYEREHRFNLWFVLVGSVEDDLVRIKQEIQTEIGLRVLDLRLEEAFFIDLGFPIDNESGPSKEIYPRYNSFAERKGKDPKGHEADLGKAPEYHDAPDLVCALFQRLQTGLSLVAQPYRALGEEVGLSEESVLGWISRWRAKGLIRRFGVVVNHHKLGFSRNAMVAFDIPDPKVSAIGQKIGQYPFVTLCYRRRRARLWWPYNLYCMIHGKSQDQVRLQVQKIISEVGLAGIAFDILFSRQKFKQRGAAYRAVRPQLLGVPPVSEALC